MGFIAINIIYPRYSKCYSGDINYQYVTFIINYIYLTIASFNSPTTPAGAALVLSVSVSSNSTVIIPSIRALSATPCLLLSLPILPQYLMKPSGFRISVHIRTNPDVVSGIHCRSANHWFLMESLLYLAMPQPQMLYMLVLPDSSHSLLRSGSDFYMCLLSHDINCWIILRI